MRSKIVKVAAAIGFVALFTLQASAIPAGPLPIPNGGKGHLIPAGPLPIPNGGGKGHLIPAGPLPIPNGGHKG